jgi:hypothetical protein
MTSRRLIILAALAIIVIAGALFLTRQPAPSQAGSPTALLYPKLEAELATVTALSIYKPGDERAVELTGKDGNWTVTERSGYAADTAKVHRLLRAIAKAKQVEEKTSNPASYAAIGVEDLSNPKATGSRVQLSGAATPVNLIVGKTGSSAQSAYVRRAGEPASWLINESIDAPTSPDAWLRKEILNVAADRVQSATVVTGAGKPYTAGKKSRADADFAVDGLPKGKQLSSPASANSVAAALTSLTLADVRAAKDFAADKPAAHATFKTFDGLVADVDGWVKDGKHYVAIKPTYDEAQAKQFHVEAAVAVPEKKAGAAEGSPPAAPATPAVDAKAEAQTADSKLSGWVYEIPDYKYEAIFKPLEDLLKK